MSVKFGFTNSSDNRGGDVVVAGHGRSVRFAVYVGQPPGSHIGFWRTKWGTLSGLNLRVGRRFRNPCVTMFVHTWTEQGRA